MSNIVPQPQITFENNKIYVDSPVDVKYTLDGLDPVFYGVIYTSPISISHTTTIKAISVNSLGEMSNLVAGTFTPESDVSDGNSNSSWVPVTYTYILNPSSGGGEDLSNYTTYSYVNSYYTSYSYINANYTTFSYLEDKNYATEQYVNDAIGSIEFPEPDLSSYITSDELAQELSSYVTKDELSAQSYVTSTDLENASYVTNTYVYDNYVKKGADITTPAAEIGNLSVEGELKVNANTYTYNIIPQEDNMYDIGSNSYRYNTVNTQRINNSNTLGGIKLSLNNTDYYSVLERAILPSTTSYSTLGNNGKHWYATYTDNLYSTYTYTYNLVLNTHNIKQDEYSIGFQINGNNTMRMFTGSFRPWIDKGATLGSSSNKWSTTYTANLYTENVSYTSGKSSIKMNDRNLDFYANNKKMINLSDYGGLVPQQTNVNLGGSSNKWGSTYISNLYADTIHNFIWTGTSAEYALLDNYTSYQIYLIKES